VLVMRIEQAIFGLLVDRVESLVSYYPDELINFAVLANVKDDMFKGCISGQSEGDILLLDQDKVLSSDEVRVITRGHSKIFASSGDRGLVSKKCGSRKTYITFLIEEKYGIGIGDVREIIDVPETLLHPPGLPSQCKGVLNLRGELIVIVDARFMYSKSKLPEGSEGKVLIFKDEGMNFGLIVDSVDAIVSFMESEAVALPELFYRKNHGSFLEDIQQAYQLDLGAGKQESLLMINPRAIAGRLAGVEA
jgi:purine-binding chemotaxis protein CheW